MSKQIDDDDNESMFDIDTTRLLEVWEKHLKLFRRYSLKLAEARYTVEVLKAQLEYVSAELDRDIRRHPDRFRIKRISEKAVEKAIILQKEYQYQVTALNKAKYKVDKLLADVKTFEQRKNAIMDAVDMTKLGWYADSVGGRSSEVMQDILKKQARSGLKRKYQKDNDDE